MRFDRPHKRRLRGRLETIAHPDAAVCRRWIVGAVVGAVVIAVGSSAAASAQAASSASPAIQVVGGTLLAGTLPSQGKPKRGGTLTVGQITGETPNYIFPLVPGAPCSAQTFNFVADQYLPLYYGPDGARPAINESLSAAETPVWSNGDKTVKITIKPGLKWSDGTPITGEDVVFFFDLLKASLNTKLGGSPANWCQYNSSSQFPYNVKSISASGRTVTMHLTGAVNPTWFLLNQLQDTNGGVYPLPSKAWDTDGTKKITDWATNPADAYKIYAYLNKQGADVSTFASSPLWKVVDGPFKLTSFSATTGAFTMVPNSDYGLEPKPSIAELSVESFTSSTAMLNALESGSLDIGNLDASTQLGSISTLQKKGYDVFGGPTWGWFGGAINFKDTTNHFNKIAAQPYMRGVFAELVPQKAIVESVYHGWAVPAYGPAPQYPSSPYISKSANKDPWPFNPGKAVKTLKAHGWDVKPNGQTTCARPGTAANECGAGIPKGTPIAFVWANVPTSSSEAGTLESEAFASEAKQAAGIDVSLQNKTFSFLTSNYDDQNPAAKKYTSSWGVNNFGGIATDYYPTQNGFMNPTAGLNMGAYNDPTANKLMNESLVSPSAKAIEHEVAYFSKSFPIFYMPDPDYILAVNKQVGGSAAAFTEMTQEQYDPALLYFKK